MDWTELRSKLSDRNGTSRVRSFGRTYDVANINNDISEPEQIKLESTKSEQGTTSTSSTISWDDLLRMVDNSLPTVQTAPQVTSSLTSTTSVQPTSSHRSEFVEDFKNNMYNALINEGVNPRSAKILTAQFALETGYGKHMTGAHNYGNIIVTDSWRKAHPDRQGVKVGTNPRTFREYASFKEAIQDTGDLMKKLYRNDIFADNTLSDSDYLTTFLNNLNGKDINGNKVSNYRWAEENYADKIREVYNKMWS